MSYGRISKKQQEILDYIKNEIQCTACRYGCGRPADSGSGEYRRLFPGAGRIYAECTELYAES